MKHIRLLLYIVPVVVVVAAWWIATYYISAHSTTGTLESGAIKPKLQDPACADPDALTFATLTRIQATVGDSLMVDDAVSGRISMRDVDDQRPKIACLRDWARTIKSACVRDEYLLWADFYDSKLNDAARELRTHEHRDNPARFRDKDPLAALARARLLRLPAPPCPLPNVERKP